MEFIFSYTSALTVLGLPAEIYDYGTQYMISCLTGFGAAFIIAKIYLPGSIKLFCAK